MSTVVREDLDALNTKLTITLKRDDIKPGIDTELKKLKSNASLKGFRKGKTPISFIKKVYGASVMSDVVQKTLNKELFKFLDDEKIKYLGQPIPASDQEEMDFSIDGSHDLIFKFDLGLTPDFELHGLEQVRTYDKYKVKIADDFINDEISSLRKRLGERKEVDEPIIAGDMISIDAEEVKAEGTAWASTFSVLFDDLLDESKKIFEGKKVGDSVKFDITKLEAEKTQEFIRKYLLNVTENDADVEIGNDFTGKIAKITRVSEAEMNEEFFNKAFGENKVSSEQEAKDFIKNQTQMWYTKQSDSILMRNIHDALMESNEFALPEDFLKRWLETTSQEDAKGTIEERFEGFKSGLKWRLLSSKLADQFDVKVDDADVKAAMKEQIARMYGGYGGDDMMDKLVESMMANQEYYESNYATAFNEKVLQAAKEEVNTKTIEVTKEEFEDIVKKYSDQKTSDDNSANSSEEE